MKEDPSSADLTKLLEGIYCSNYKYTAAKLNDSSYLSNIVRNSSHELSA